MKLRIEIECDNDVFEQDPFIEIDRILQGVSSRLALGDKNVKLYDSNGNSVGVASFTR